MFFSIFFQIAETSPVSNTGIILLATLLIVIVLLGVAGVGAVGAAILVYTIQSLIRPPSAGAGE